MDMVSQYLEYRRTPKELRQQVLRYFALKYPGQRVFDEDEILGSLSATLKAHIDVHNGARSQIELGTATHLAAQLR